ncbi:HIT family protein, partial [Enterobacter hormaechei]
MVRRSIPVRSRKASMSLHGVY